LPRFTICISALLVALGVPSKSSAQSFPQGLTCGLSYKEQSCTLIGTDCSQSVPEDNTCNGVHTAAPISVLVTCTCVYPGGDLSAHPFCPADLNGGVAADCVSTCAPIGTNTCTGKAILGTEGNAAPGYTTVFDGDVGEDTGFGYRHQELVNGFHQCGGLGLVRPTARHNLRAPPHRQLARKNLHGLQSFPRFF
jgi:hypothetical protein